MRDITPNHQLSNEFRINDEYIWASEPERDATWDLNDFEWKKKSIWDLIEDMTKDTDEEEVEEEDE
ncbi:MAG: hypothetical protein DRP51_06070 [Candidatus Zixiibacteriota bacterium]|nr:MAG: hypothetical protein DRP51_06070 [candidate division Zixibacteria bacterium]